jgi:hypothetical protein
LSVAKGTPLSGSFAHSIASSTTSEARAIDYSLVSAGYFQTLEIPFLSGRTFTAAEEKDGLPVVIVSETAARSLWPGSDAVGQELQLAVDPDVLKNSPLAPFRSAVVIGVVRNAVSGVLAFGIDRAVAYYPTAITSRQADFLLSTRGEDNETIRRLAADLDRQLPGAMVSLQTLQAQLSGQAFPFLLAFWISNVVAGIALLLTLTGVYGVLSYVVTQRTKEFGIRMALGASRSAVTRLVLGQSLQLAGWGIAIGVLLAAATSKVIGTLVEAFLRTFEPTAYAGGVVITLFACLIAAWIPSRRATLVDPTTTMRHD